MTLAVLVPASTFCPSPKLPNMSRGATSYTPGMLRTASMSSLVNLTWRPGP